jgi:histidyl-tRNA synthetase
MERLVELLRGGGLVPEPAVPHLYLVPLGERAERQAPALAERVRELSGSLRLELHCGGGGTRSRMKKADRSGAAFAMIVGEDELDSGSVVLKPLREQRDQETIPITQIVDYLRRHCADLD